MKIIVRAINHDKGFYDYIRQTEMHRFMPRLHSHHRWTQKTICKKTLQQYYVLTTFDDDRVYSNKMRSFIYALEEVGNDQDS